jgi:hypothetical protein
VGLADTAQARQPSGRQDRREANVLERFPAKWTRFGLRKRVKTRNLEPRFDAIETEKALDARALPLTLSACSQGSALERAMEEYCAYVIGPDGHIFNRVDIRSPDEKEARRLAKIAVDGHAVELWQADRLIERFEPEH